MATKYVTQSGTAPVDGTLEHPYSIADFNSNTDSFVAAGNTIVFGPVGTRFHTRLVIPASGTAAAPIILDGNGCYFDALSELSSWSLISGEVYKMNPTGNVILLTEDGNLLTPIDLLGESEETAAATLTRGQFTLIVNGGDCIARCSDGADPATHSMYGVEYSAGADLGVLSIAQDYITLRNMTVQYKHSGLAYEGGIRINGDGVIVESSVRCEYNDNGVYVLGGSKVDINGGTFTANYNAGIGVDQTGDACDSLVIRNSTISYNGYEPRYNGEFGYVTDCDGIGIGGGGGTITKCKIYGNRILYNGPPYASSAEFPSGVTGDTNRGSGIYIGTSNALSADVDVYLNYFEGNHRTHVWCNTGDFSGGKVYSNIMVGGGNDNSAAARAAIVMGTSAGVVGVVSNNTITGFRGNCGIYLGNSTAADAASIICVNNVVDNVSMSDGMTEWRGSYWFAKSDDTVTFSNNATGVITASNGRIIYRTAGYTTLAAYQAVYSGSGAGTVTGDPLLGADYWPANPDLRGAGTWLAGIRAYDDLPLPLAPDIGAVQDRTAAGRRFGVGGGKR